MTLISENNREVKPLLKDTYYFDWIVLYNVGGLFVRNGC